MRRTPKQYPPMPLKTPPAPKAPPKRGVSVEVTDTIRAMVLAQVRRLVANMSEVELLEYRRLIRKQIGLSDNNPVQ
jgi:hypothetical protein